MSSAQHSTAAGNPLATLSTSSAAANCNGNSIGDGGAASGGAASTSSAIGGTGVGFAGGATTAAATTTSPFAHRSPVSSSPHDPLLSLSSHCVRVAFGPTVQLVADALQLLGGPADGCGGNGGDDGDGTMASTSLPELLSYLKKKCPPQPKSSRLGILCLSSSQASSSPASSSRSQQSYYYEPSSIRAALLVLVQHGIVSYSGIGRHHHHHHHHHRSDHHHHHHRSIPRAAYAYHPSRARNLMRYARYVEWMKKSADETSAAVVQTLLVRGRLRTVDWMVFAVRDLREAQGGGHGGDPSSSASASGEVGGGGGGGTSAHHRYTLRQQVVEVAYRLVKDGFVRQVDPIALRGDDDEEEDPDEGEYEFQDEEQQPEKKEEQQPPPPTKRVRIQEPDKPATSASANAANAAAAMMSDAAAAASTGEDPAILSLLAGNAHYKATLPVDAVWRVNASMFHEYFRAFHVGRLVAERYGQRVQACGSLVSAALKHRAQQRHNDAARRGAGDFASGAFEPRDVARHLPKGVMQVMEKKAGGLQHNLAKAFDDLCGVAHDPPVVRRCGGASGTYEIAIPPVVEYLQQRVTHQIIRDRHGEVAARVVHILGIHGWLESETIAEHAMMPLKDAREVLHALYRNRYVELMQFSSSTRQPSHYNPSNAIYLWGLYKDRLRRKITENVAQALWNIRLRRQHEAEVGKDWIERARQRQQLPDNNDENDHETDKLNYLKFCLGLERLDVAAHGLDETLLVMKDFEL